MPPTKLDNDQLIQFRITKAQKDILKAYASSQHITVAELARQQLRELISRINNSVRTA